jgi:hypothetical protein
MKTRIILINTFIGLFTNSIWTQDLIINELMSSNITTVFDIDGNSDDWIELYNGSNNSINLSGLFLSDDINNLEKWEFPEIEIATGEYILIWASGDFDPNNNELHTNFKISSSGEKIFLVSSDGTSIIDSSPEINLPPDISIGRSLNSGLEWFFYNEATPMMINQSTSYNGIAEIPLYSHDRGFYDTPFSLELTPSNPQDNIYYTLDGSEPTINSNLYSDPIAINQTTTLRTKVFRVENLPSKIFTHSYIFENDYNLDVISLVSSSDNFWGTNGIYDNYNSGEERPIHMEYLNLDGAPGFSLDLGVKIHAPDNRPQQSLRLYARAKYGQKKINYQIFEEKEIDIFRGLVLRNGGNDGAQIKKTHIRDAFTHKVFQQINSDYAVAAYLPVHVYINGDYWGIYNLRERQDEHYIKENYGYDDDEIDFLEYDYAEPNHTKIISGNWNDFTNLKNFITNNDLNSISNYSTVENWIDIDNFIDYQVTEIFIGNQDWCNNNIKFWRPTNDDSKWKWVLWDTDYGLGAYSTYPVGNPSFNFFSMAMTWCGWGNGDYTWMLRKLMENENFKWKFISRTLDLLNTAFKPSYSISQFEFLADGIDADIPYQLNRWGASTYSDWGDDLIITNNFLSERPEYFRNHIADKLEFSPTIHEITVDVSDPEMGWVQLNSILIDESFPGIDFSPYPWNGDYFEDISIHAKAIAKPGYQFIHWEGISNEESEEISFQLLNNATLTAIFIEDRASDINELNVMVFPTIVEDYLGVNISLIGSHSILFQVTNLLGQILYSEKNTSNGNYQSRINLSDLSTGTYLLIVTTELGESSTKKFYVK